MSERDRVGVLGLGGMGGPMAARLIRAGFDVTVYDPVPASTERFAGLGARVAASAAEVVRLSEITVTSLPSADVLEAVASEVADELGPGGSADIGDGANSRSANSGPANSGAANSGPATNDSVASESVDRPKFLIDTTTSYPEASIRAAAMLASVGVGMLDAPVSGGRQGATDGTLSIMIGGPSEALEACGPVLAELGTTITHFGEAVGAGGYAKLANQIIVSLHHSALAEAFAFAERAGLDLSQLVPALQAGWAASTVLDVKASKMIDKDYSPIGTVAIQDKDLTYILEAAKGLGVDLPASELVKDQFGGLLDQGFGGEDQIALLHLYSQEHETTSKQANA